MEKVIKIKNTSRRNFSLNLSFVTAKKVLDLKPETEIEITSEEYQYLSTQCPNAFASGCLKVVSAKEDFTGDIIESQNVMSDVDIEALMELTPAKLRNKLKNITSIDLVNDIRIKADELGKSDKFMDEINIKIDELANGNILL